MQRQRRPLLPGPHLHTLARGLLLLLLLLGTLRGCCVRPSRGACLAVSDAMAGARLQPIFGLPLADLAEAPPPPADVSVHVSEGGRRRGWQQRQARHDGPWRAGDGSAAHPPTPRSIAEHTHASSSEMRVEALCAHPAGPVVLLVSTHALAAGMGQDALTLLHAAPPQLASCVGGAGRHAAGLSSGSL